MTNKEKQEKDRRRDRRIFALYSSGIRGIRQIQKALRTEGIITPVFIIRWRIDNYIYVKRTKHGSVYIDIDDFRNEEPLRVVTKRPPVKPKIVPNFSKSLCPICLKQPANSPHHIVPRSMNGSNDPKNIVYLCKTCHDIVEEYAEKGTLYSPRLARLIRTQL